MEKETYNFLKEKLYARKTKYNKTLIKKFKTLMIKFI